MKGLIFPGQGAQVVGMGKDFYQTFASAKEIFQRADDLLGRPLSKIIFEGPENELTETQNSQVAIFVVSMAVLSALGDVRPDVCAGHSLGEYTALTASGRLTFEQALRLVQARGTFMAEACRANKGAMAAVIGLDDVEAVVAPIDGVWVANYNCPGQVVISGTPEGIKAAAEACAGARRFIPLNVHGAFHSPLMKEAEEKLAAEIASVEFADSPVRLVMNVPGDFVDEIGDVPKYLSQQVTGSVRWDAGIRKMAEAGVEEFIEIGCGNTLAGLNRRIGVGSTTSIYRLQDLEKVETCLS